MKWLCLLLLLGTLEITVKLGFNNDVDAVTATTAVLWLFNSFLLKLCTLYCLFTMAWRYTDSAIWWLQKIFSLSARCKSYFNEKRIEYSPEIIFPPLLLFTSNQRMQTFFWLSRYLIINLSLHFSNTNTWKPQLLNVTIIAIFFHHLLLEMKRNRKFTINCFFFFFRAI